jgi:hypothetical protein
LSEGWICLYMYWKWGVGGIELTRTLLFKTRHLFYCYLLNFSLFPTALQPGVGLGLHQEFPPSLPV